MRSGSAAEARQAALAGWIPSAIGVIATLLVHIAFVHTLIFGLGGRGTSLSPYYAANADFGPLELLSLSQAADPGAERPRENRSLRPLPPRLAVSEVPRLPPSDAEKQPAKESQLSAKIVDGPAFIKLCRDNYPDAAHFERDLATVSLQGGSIDISGGDRQRALMALRCLRAFGTFGTELVGQSAPGT